METVGDFPLALLPSLALECVFDAYIVAAMPTHASRRRAQRWLATHWTLRDINEFCRAARRAHTRVTTPSVLVAGTRLFEWEEFEDVLPMDSGSLTLVVGARGASGKTTAAKRLVEKMSAEIDRVCGVQSSTDERLDALMIRGLEGARTPEDIERSALRLACRTRMGTNRAACRPRAVRIDGTAALFPLTRAGFVHDTKLRLKRCAAVFRHALVHAVAVPNPDSVYDPSVASLEADWIVVSTGSGFIACAAAAAVAAPLVGMDEHRLLLLLHYLPPFTAVVFERLRGSTAGRHVFDPATTRISAVSGLLGEM